MKTAEELNEKFDVESHNADVFIDDMIQNTIVYTLDDVNKIIKALEKQEGK